VLDRSGLKGRYDFTLTWVPPVDDAGQPGGPAGDTGPSMFTALEGQLGLRLESGRGQVETLMLESARRPSSN
jgi:uncharacterized protein (TIGR03435 family)